MYILRRSQHHPLKRPVYLLYTRRDLCDLIDFSRKNVVLALGSSPTQVRGDRRSIFKDFGGADVVFIPRFGYHNQALKKLATYPKKRIRENNFQRVTQRYTSIIFVTQLEEFRLAHQAFQSSVATAQCWPIPRIEKTVYCKGRPESHFCRRKLCKIHEIGKL